jgi:thiosulfate/3-mercaptopyruvate sulfurtransferase
MTTRQAISSLVQPAWLDAHKVDKDVRIIEIAGMGQENLSAYRSGHIPGAIVWPWKRMLWDDHIRDFPKPEELARRLGAAGITNATTVVVYGEPVQFGIYAWWTLRYCGHADVRVLDGGRRRWIAEGRGLTNDEPRAFDAVEYRPTMRSEAMRIGRDAILASLARDDIALVDARSAEEYAGLRVGAPGTPDVGAERAGRIPGARHLEYLELLTEDESFKTVRELEAILASRGVTSDNDVIAYCRGSHRASVLYFALTQLLGYKRAKVYDGSWTEWGSMVGMPIER